MDSSPPVIAGVVSTLMFGLSMLPMLGKALRTKDLRSYSLGNILLSNTGNAIHSIYVFSLPPGPIWLLHSFHVLSTALMLIWYLRYELQPVVAWGRLVGGITAVVPSFGSTTRPPRYEPPSVSVPDRPASAGSVPWLTGAITPSGQRHEGTNLDAGMMHRRTTVRRASDAPDHQSPGPRSRDATGCERQMMALIHDLRHSSGLCKGTYLPTYSPFEGNAPYVCPIR